MPHRSLGSSVRMRVGTAVLALVLAGGLAGCQPAGTPDPVSSPTASASAVTTPAPSPTGASTASPSSTSRASSSTTRPTPTIGSTTPSAPSSPPTPAGPNRTLTRNAIYRVDLGRRTVSCRLKVRTPKPPLRNSQLAPYLRTVVKCLVKAFDTPLADRGFDLTTPKVKSYAKRIKTPCGTFGQNGAPAYYCSSTRTIYWPLTGDDDNEAYTFARLGYVGLIAHEFGHHLQATTGMLTDYGSRYYAASKKHQYTLSRRLELQAQCFEGVFLAAAGRSISLTANDRYQLRVWHGYTGDEDPPSSRKPDHGSSTAQIRWLNRGLDSADFGRCNTWGAKAETVR